MPAGFAVGVKGAIMNLFLLYMGAGLTAAWGIAHLFPTRSVVAGFGSISRDNKHVITMEWIVEGVALLFISAQVATVTWIDPTSAVSKASYLISSTALMAFALVSLFTGFRIDFIPYRLCPFIFTASAVLILVGAVA
jgi:hypothetical protein